MPVLGSAGSSGVATGSSTGLTAPVIKRGVYAPQGWGSAWFPARDASASQLVEVVWVGDSTTVGDSTGNASTPVTKLARAKSIAAGYTDGGRGAAPRGLTDAAADSAEGLPLVQSNTGFTTGDGNAVYVTLNPYSATAGNTITFQGVGTRCRILYPNFNNGGRFSYSANGAAKVNIDPINTAGAWLAGWVEITGLPGGGATNTVTVRNEGGWKLGPLNTATSIQANSTGAGPTAGTYYYVVTVYNVDKTLESTPNTPGAGATVNGSQTVNGLFNVSTAAINGFSYSIASGRAFAVYRSTSASGPFQYLKDVTPASNVNQAAFTDDGTVTPNAARTPPTSTPDATDGSTRNIVKATAEFYNDAGIVYHNAGISGANAGTYFDVTDIIYNQAAQTLFGLGPSATNADQQGPSATPGARKPKLVVINFGINDLGSTGADTDALTIANRLSLGIRMAQNAGASVVLLVPPLDVVNGNSVPPRVRQGIMRTVIWQTGVSHGCAVVDLNVALGPSSGYPAKGYNLGNNNPHPSAAAYQAEVDFIWNNVLSL